MASQIRRVLGEKDVNIPPVSPSKQLAAKNPLSNLYAPPTTTNTCTKPLDISDSAAPISAELPPNTRPISPTTTSPTKAAAPPTGTKRPRPEPTSDDDHEREPKQPRLRLGSPFSESTTSPTKHPRPTPLTESHIASLPQPQPVAREISASPTLVDAEPSPSAATLLRTRLTLALFKIRTDQTTSPLSELEIHSYSPSASAKPSLTVQDPPEETMRRFRRREGRGGRSVAQRLLGPIGTGSGMRGVGSVVAPAAVDDHAGDGEAEEVLPTTENDNPATPSSVASLADHAADQPKVPSADPTELKYGPVITQDGDLTSSAVKDRAADSLLALGGDTTRDRYREWRRAMNLGL